jgi:hypothetical protein
MIPAKRDEADHRGRTERRAEQPVARHDPKEGQRDRRQDHQRQLERPELRHDQDVDAQKRHPKGRPHVAEGDEGHFPLAIPQQRDLALILEGWPCSETSGLVPSAQSIASIRSETASIP